MKPELMEKTVRKRPGVNADRAANKKKVLAVCLLVIMAVLWVRVFAGKKSPGTVVAGSAAMGYSALVQADSGEMAYKDLPFIQGRHDVLAKNIFASKSWRGFKSSSHTGGYGSAEIGIDNNADSEQALQIASAVKDIELVAIVSGQQYQAFMEDKLLAKGDSFNYEFQGKTHKFTVVDIYKNKVELECNGVVVFKKMPQQPFMAN